MNAGPKGEGPKQGQPMTTPAPGAQQLLKPSELSFDTLCNLFEFLTGKEHGRARSWTARRKILDRFLETCVWRGSKDAYALFRLVLPSVRNGGSEGLATDSVSYAMDARCLLCTVYGMRMTAGA